MHLMPWQVSFIVRTVCTIRNTDVHLGIRANFPFLLAKLPEAWVANSRGRCTARATNLAISGEPLRLRKNNKSNRGGRFKFPEKSFLQLLCCHKLAVLLVRN